MAQTLRRGELHQDSKSKDHLFRKKVDEKDTESENKSETHRFSYL